MADEDALFAEFMGEIKSTVLESAPATDNGMTKSEGGDVSDTASVGGDLENKHEGQSKGLEERKDEKEKEKDLMIDTSKRKEVPAEVP